MTVVENQKYAHATRKIHAKLFELYIRILYELRKKVLTNYISTDKKKLSSLKPKQFVCQNHSRIDECNTSELRITLKYQECLFHTWNVFIWYGTQLLYASAWEVNRNILD